MLFQLRVMRMAAGTSASSSSRLLQGLVGHYAGELGFRTPIYVGFDETYFSTGSFSYYKTFGQRLPTEYFVVVVDPSDPVAVWPLFGHEIAHCWLSNYPHGDTVMANSPSDDTDSLERQAFRVEEALCDVVATRLMGVLYPMAFVSRLFVSLGDVSTSASEGHPLFSFRIECITRTLVGMGLVAQAERVSELTEGYINTRWESDEIAWSMDAIISLARSLPRGRTGADSPTGHFDKAWRSMFDGQPTTEGINSASAELLGRLERWTVPSDA
jgi:hypothetical protein